MIPPPIRPEGDAFGHSASLRTGDAPQRISDLSLQETNEIRLLLRGESVVDWHRLDFADAAQAERLLRLNGFASDDPADLERIETLRAEAARYITETLRLRVNEELMQLPIVDLVLLASSQSKGQRGACTLLKVMHVLHHLEARELRTRLAIADNELFSLVEESVVSMFDELRQAGVSVTEFSWSRKTRASLLTKMMVKPETSAARVFDRLRFRLIVERAEELALALHVMLHRCIPFNYIVPRQTVNTLVDPLTLDEHAERLSSRPNGATVDDFSPMSSPNEFSSRDFRMLNFIADLPVRVDELVWGDAEVDTARGRVVFVLAEFQVMDDATARRNEAGASSHAAYKARQHQRVKERLLHRPHEA